MNYYLCYACKNKFRSDNLSSECPHCHSDMIWKYKSDNKIR
jgi:DNA-directed RNA polymerase subunit RPC12/RpoP